MDDFNAWYDQFVVDSTQPGILQNDRRYENSSAEGSPQDPQFLALYDIADDDLSTAWPRTAAALQDLYPTFPDYIEVTLAGTYERADTVAEQTAGASDVGVTLLLADEGADQCFDSLISRLAEGGLVFNAARFTLVEGFPEPPSVALLIETYDEPAFEYATRAQDEVAAASGSVRLASAFRRQSPAPS